MARFFHPIKPLLLGWLVSLLACGAIALILGWQMPTGTGDFWAVAVTSGVRDWGFWALAAPLVFRFVARHPLERRRWFIIWPAHLAVFAATMLAAQGWKAGVEWSFGKSDARPAPPDGTYDGPPSGPPPGPPPEGGMPGPGRGFDLFLAFRFDAPIYLALVCLAHVAIYRRRLHERAHHLARARLNALRTQLQPHFLFNTLNTIAGLVYDQPAKADAMLVALSDLLRLSLEASSATENSLQREVEYIERYLAIIMARFEDRIRYEIDIADDAREGLVPAFILQPLVENAVQHGLQPKPEGGTVSITARREGGRLRVTVADDGVGFRHRSNATEGIGLGNARARLAELHGSKASLEMYDGPRTEVIIVLPFRAAPHENPHHHRR